MSSKKPIFLQSINVVAFIFTVVVNALAGSTTLLGGKTSGEISDLYPTLITPAGFTFSIWGIIYILLLVFIVYQTLQRNREQPFLNQISFLFLLSGILNILWLFLWHYELITFSLVLMFALLSALIAIYLRLNIGKGEAPLWERICVHLPFSVYLGWITVASIANVSVALIAAGWDGGGIGQVTWAVLVIVVALFITLTAIATRKDVAYGFVIVWALVGIMSKQIDNQTVVFGGRSWYSNNSFCYRCCGCCFKIEAVIRSLCISEECILCIWFVIPYSPVTGSLDRERCGG